MSNNFNKYYLVAFISLIVLGALFLYQKERFYDGKLHVVICNVGQGDGIFIRSPKGQDIIIDGGPDDSILSCLSEHMPFWDRQIEVMILTHPHEDHLNGLINVLKRYSVLSFYTEKQDSNSEAVKELKKILKEKNLTEKFLEKGDRFDLGELLTLETVWPARYASASVAGGPPHQVQLQGGGDFDANGFSLMQMLNYNKFNLLLTGDGEMSNLNYLKQKIDVLKVAHHGSKNNLDEDFFSATQPELGVISVGRKNRYGHPSYQTLEMLKKLGIRVLRTDLNGEIEIISDGKAWGYKLN